MWNVDKKIKNRCLALVPLLICLLTACGEGERPVLGELVIDSVSYDAVSCHIEVVEGTPYDYAFCYGTTKVAAEKVTATKVKGTYSAPVISGTISGLNPNSVYYIRGYAMNAHGLTYTTTLSVKTLTRVPTIGDNQYPNVDNE